MDQDTMNYAASHDKIPVSRRHLNRLTGLGLAALMGMATTVGTNAKKKGKKVTLCLDGQTVTVKKNKQKPLLARGATRGPCPAPATCLRPSENLQAAIASAAPGASLQLCAGTWSLPDTVTIENSLTLMGAGIEATVLDGRNAVRPLRVNAGATVTLQDLTISHGKAPGALAGGGIRNAGDLTLRGVVVSGCAAESGGGIYTGNGSTLTVTGDSRIRENTATSTGGGIHSNSGTVRLEADSQIAGNDAGSDGGGIFDSDGTVLLMEGSHISENSSGSRGGGICSLEGAVTLEGGSYVTGNTCTLYGGGIFNLSGSITLKTNGHVTGNTAGVNGGGVWKTFGTVTQEAGSEVADNLPDDCATPDGPCP